MVRTDVAEDDPTCTRNAIKMVITATITLLTVPTVVTTSIHRMTHLMRARAVSPLINEDSMPTR